MKGTPLLNNREASLRPHAAPVQAMLAAMDSRPEGLSHNDSAARFALHALRRGWFAGDGVTERDAAIKS